MTRKHYEAIARTIRQRLPGGVCDDYTRGQYDTVIGIAYKLADYFETENPNFNKARFLDACLEG